MNVRRFWLLILLVCLVIPCEARSVWNGDKSRNVVALTFDDGPKPEYCIPILESLDEYGAKATFFVVGEEAEKNPDLIMRMSDAGHEIGNHSYSHITAKEMSASEFIADVKKCSRVIYGVTGRAPKYFRSPGGAVTPAVSKGIRRMGMSTVFWSLNADDYTELSENFEIPDDYQQMSLVLAKKVLDKVKPGTIILLHSSSEQTVRALPAILKGLKEKGYGMVALDELLEENI